MSAPLSQRLRHERVPTSSSCRRRISLATPGVFCTAPKHIQLSASAVCDPLRWSLGPEHFYAVRWYLTKKCQSDVGHEPGLPQCRSTTWAELAIDCELSTGMELVGPGVLIGAIRHSDLLTRQLMRLGVTRPRRRVGRTRHATKSCCVLCVTCAPRLVLG